MKETDSSMLSCNQEGDLLRALTRGASLTTRLELAQWLQHDAQPWIPHQVFLWAEFRDGIEECAVLSAPQQVRAMMDRGAWVPRLMAYFADCWIAAQHTPMRVPLAGCEALLGPDFHALQQRAGFALVHGVVDRHGGTKRVFAALKQPALLVENVKQPELSQVVGLANDGEVPFRLIEDAPVEDRDGGPRGFIALPRALNLQGDGQL